MYSSGYGRCTEADLTGTVYLGNMNKIYVLKYALCLICLENFRVGIAEQLEKNIFSREVVLVMSLYLKNQLFNGTFHVETPFSHNKNPQLKQNLKPKPNHQNHNDSVYILDELVATMHTRRHKTRYF